VSGLAVIDIDGPQGEAAWADLCERFGEPPPTYEVRTPRGGRHLYFTGELPNTVQKLGAKIDTRGVGGFVVAAGSRTVAGPKTVDGDYVALNDLAPAALPAWVGTLARHHAEQAAAVEEMDLPSNVARAKEWLSRRAPAVEGQGGDNWTYETACHVRGLGVSEGQALELMLEWNERCEPPWEPDDLAAKVANAFEYGQNETGAWGLGPIPESWAGVAAAGHGQAAEPIQFEALGSLLNSTPAPVAEIIGGLVETHVFTTLSGPGGSHKSRLGLQLGLCVSAGVPVFGRPVERSAFVYLSFEDPRDEVVRRVHALSRRLNLPKPPDPETAFHYLDRTGRPEPLLIVREEGGLEVTDFGHQMIGRLKAIPGHKLVLIDGTYNAVRFVGKAKINEDCVMSAIGWFDALCAAADCTIISLWHPSQAGQERGDAGGWSVAWNNRPRARLSIGAVKGQDDTFELKVEKRNHGPKGPPITLHWSGGALLPRAETDAAEASERFMRTCIDAAATAAGQGMPLTMQKTPPKWVFDEVERASSYRPTQRQIKEALAQALRDNRLRYMKGNHSRAAGYYPFDPDCADEMAAEAKRQQTAAKGSIGLGQ
jgi:hypothetical protein